MLSFVSQANKTKPNYSTGMHLVIKSYSTHKWEGNKNKLHLKMSCSVDDVCLSLRLTVYVKSRTSNLHTYSNTTHFSSNEYIPQGHLYRRLLLHSNSHFSQVEKWIWQMWMTTTQTTIILFEKERDIHNTCTSGSVICLDCLTMKSKG